MISMGIQIYGFHHGILLLIKFLNYYLLSLNNNLSVVRRIFKKWINISQGCCHLFVSKDKIKGGEKKNPEIPSSWLQSWGNDLYLQT